MTGLVVGESEPLRRWTGMSVAQLSPSVLTQLKPSSSAVPNTSGQTTRVKISDGVSGAKYVRRHSGKNNNKKTPQI